MRLKNLLLICIFLGVFISFISAINAEIMISQPKGVYSLGDELNVEVKLDSIKSGYLDVSLVCNGNQTNIYHNVPESKTIIINRQLTPTYIQNLYGNCYISAEYADEIESSPSFEASKVIDVDLQSINLSIKAGGAVRVKGVAYKRNGQLTGQIYSAFINAEIIDNLGTVNITKSDVIDDGQFNLELYIPETTHAGKKSIVVTVYDKDSQGNILNSGETSTNIEITQEPAKITVAIDTLLINPGENVTIIPFLYDKAGDSIGGKVSINILNSKNESVYGNSLNANEELVLTTSPADLPGITTVVIEKDGLRGEKAFQLTELKKVSAEISGNILTISNIGNVAYKDNVEVKIGNRTFIEYVDLDYGEKIEYEISAPDGEYAITVKDSSGDSELLSQSGVSLTGSAISMRETGQKIENLFLQYPIVWIFITLVLALLLWIFYRKYQREKRLPAIIERLRGDKNKIRDFRKNSGVEIIAPEKRDQKIDEVNLRGGIKRAEQVLVLQGQKQPVSVIALKIKDNIQGIARQNLFKSLENAYKHKAVSHISGDSIIIIFSPLLTKTFKNEETAIRVALDIDSDLKEHNRRFRNDTINYGIGINCGDIINKIDMKTLQFANIGKTIGLAKRVAEVSSQEVLLSRDIHEKTMNTVKAEKVATGSMDLFTIKRVVDSEKSSKFIQDFLKRNQ